MNKTNVMELRGNLEWLAKKVKLATVQLDLLESDETFNDSDLWLLASATVSTLKTVSDDIKSKFDIK